MSVLIGLGLTIALLVAAVLNNAYIGWPLLAGYLYFAALGLKRGYTLRQVARFSRDGARRAFIVVPILLLLGCLIAMWMAAGTVSSFVYYCLALISPPLFILFAFLATCGVSLLLGSALGTVGTIGVILMAMAKGGNVSPYLAAGAIISAAYVGDRCSPMSSALYLLSAVTETEPYRNLSMVLKTSVAPVLLTALLYLPLSLLNPLAAADTGLQQSIAQYFSVSIITFAPALIIVTLCCFRVPVKLSMLVSAISALLIAVFVQGVGPSALLPALFWGFEPGPDSALTGIIHGGGLWGMLKTSLILLLACGLTEVLQGVGALRGLEKLLAKPGKPLTLYLKTLALSLVSGCCGCNQSIAIVLCGQLLRKPYELSGRDHYDLARDISYTALPLAAAIPWSVASMVPTTTLGVPLAQHLPYLFYPFMVPLFYGLYYAVADIRGRKSGGSVKAGGA